MLSDILIVLLALGGWGKTPSPPNDPDAPDPVGNDGELTLDIDGEKTHLLVQSARITSERSPYLVVEGEKIGNVHQFMLYADSPNPELPHDLGRLEHIPLPLAEGDGSPSWVSNGSGEEIKVSGGRVRLLQITGSGPWEIDADVELDTPNGMLQGTLKARVRPE